MQKAKVSGLVELLGTGSTAEFKMGNLSVGQLAAQFSTPFYVYNGDVILRKIERVRQALGPETDLYYSMKANPSLGLCQLIASQGVGAEIASVGELLLAEKAGFPPAETIFAGPGKTETELDLANQLGILAVNVESAGELRRLSQISQMAGRPTNVGVRVNLAQKVNGTKMRGGGYQRFGIDVELLDGLLDEFSEDPYLRFLGPHVYCGTQIFDVEALAADCHAVVDLALSMADRMGRPLEMINFGGGFGVPYSESTPEFDLERFGARYHEVVARCKNDPRLASAKLIVELGRYLVAEAGVYVTRVVDVKVSQGNTFVVTDGGMNHHITATGNFGQVLRKAHPIALLNRLDAPIHDPVTLVGPCCTPLDTFAQDMPFPQVNVGDLVGVFYSGAYGYSASSLAFLGHPTPSEILIWQGKSHLLRAPGRPEAILEGQNSLP